VTPNSQPWDQLPQIGHSNGMTDPARSVVAESRPAFKPWQTVWRRKWRVVFSLTFAVALATSFAVLTGPWYESTAQVLVRKKRLETTPISGPNLTQPAEDYLATHMLLITSPRIARQAVTNRNLETLEIFNKKDPLAAVIDSPSRYISGNRPKGSPEDALANRIVGSLRASSDTMKPGTAPSHEVLSVSFQGNVSEDCSKVLDAVIASYQDFLKESYQDVNAETLELITRARDVLQKDIATKEAAYAEFRRNTPVLWKGKDGITIQQDRLFNIDAKRSAMRMRQAEINASLQAIEKAKREGRSLGEILDLVSGLPANQEILTPTHFGNSDPGMAARNTRVTLEEELVRLRLEEERLLESYGPANPKVQAIRNQIRSVSKFIKPSAAGEGSDATPSAWEADLVNLRIELLKRELVESERADKALRELFEHDQLDAKGAMVHEIEDESRRSGIERSKVLYESIVGRLREIDSVRDYGGYDTQIIAAPKSGLNKRKYLVVFLGALVTGLLAGFGWACLAEFRDRSFRSFREIRDQLGLPVVGHIPFFRPRTGMSPTPESNGAALDPSLRSYAEAYLAVRVALYHTTNAGECRVIQITSAIHGEGKTTLAANLAVSMAQSGKRVVLIDADLRRPRLADLFGLSKQVGLTSVLSGETELAAAMQPSAVPGLSILGSGPLSPSPAETVASPRLRTLLDSLRQQCDYVLIDTPPLLDVTDPRVVAHVVDGVLLTLRNSKQGRPLAQSAREILDATGANILGVVVNGVACHSGSGDYAYAPHSGRRRTLRFMASRA